MSQLMGKSVKLPIPSMYVYNMSVHNLCTYATCYLCRSEFIPPLLSILFRNDTYSKYQVGMQSLLTS